MLPEAEGTEGQWFYCSPSSHEIALPTLMWSLTFWKSHLRALSLKRSLLSRDRSTVLCWLVKHFFLPNDLSKSLLRIFDFARWLCNFWVSGQQKELLTSQQCTVDQSTVHCWPVNSALLTGHVKNDVTKHEMSRCQRRASAYCWQYFSDLKQFGNRTVISWLLGEQSNHCPFVVEKKWETVSLGLPPLATVSQIYSTTSGQWFDCSPLSHEITVYPLCQKLQNYRVTVKNS